MIGDSQKQYHRIWNFITEAVGKAEWCDPHFPHGATSGVARHPPETPFGSYGQVKLNIYRTTERLRRAQMANRVSHRGSGILVLNSRDEKLFRLFPGPETRSDGFSFGGSPF